MNPYGIAVAFVVLFCVPYALESVTKPGRRQAALALGWIWIIASLYCVAAGLMLVGDWHDPLAGVDTTRMNNPKAHLLIPVIRYWPYALIVLGSLFAWASLRLIKQTQSRTA